MSDLHTIESLDFVEQTEEQKAEAEVAHIIDRGDDPRNAQAIILEARVMGTPLTALCGFVFVPAKDPEKLPVCEACKEMHEIARNFYGFV